MTDIPELIKNMDTMVKWPAVSGSIDRLLQNITGRFGYRQLPIELVSNLHYWHTLQADAAVLINLENTRKFEGSFRPGKAQAHRRQMEKFRQKLLNFNNILLFESLRQ